MQSRYGVSTTVHSVGRRAKVSQFHHIVQEDNDFRFARHPTAIGGKLQTGLPTSHNGTSESLLLQDVPYTGRCSVDGKLN
jgi:hypothetical protein